MMIWAFNKADDTKARELVYHSVKNGKSRFGWSQKDEHNLKLKDNWTDWHAKQLFLLQIKKGDWILHTNTPVWGKCIAAKVTSEYDFDDGLNCDWGPDFRHCFEIDVSTIVEFDRKDTNILPSVNLNPRQRYHRIYAADDFLQSIKNLKYRKIKLRDGETKEEYHLKDKTDKYLKEITGLIHEMHKGKRLERFLAMVFRRIPGVIDVNENGFGWGTDNGADLIITVRSSIGNLDIEESRIVVQVKSFDGEHYDLKAVEQVKTGVEKYKAKAGLIITTAQRTERLENKIEEISKELNCPIDLLSGEDVAKVVIKYASDLLFRLETII